MREEVWRCRCGVCAQHLGGWRTWCITNLCSPTRIIGDPWVSGGWGGCRVSGSLMLDLSEVGSGGQAKHCMAMILHGVVVPSTPSLISKSACPSLSLSAIGIPIIVTPSSLTSPTFLHLPSVLFFSRVSPLYQPIAPLQSLTVSTPVIIISLAIVVVASSTFSHFLLLIFAIFHYFSLFNHSPGPSYFTRWFAFMLFIFGYIIVPSPGPPTTQRMLQQA